MVASELDASIVGREARRRRLLAVLLPARPGYLACVLLALPLVVLWSLATPRGGVPDDSASLITAAAVVRGEFGGPLVQTPAGTAESTRVPGGIVALRDVADCLEGNDTLPNQCAPPPALPNVELSTVTQFNRYPPLSYLLVGWPTLFLTGNAAYWAATLVAAIINSLLLGLALWLLLTYLPSRLAVIGWLTALTPQVLYLAGSINASGFEIATAIAAWSGLLTLATISDPPDRLVGCTVGCTLMFMVTRPLSPAWVVLAIVISAIVAGRERVRALAGMRSVRIGAAVLMLGAAIALAWLVAVGRPILLPVGPPPTPVSASQAFRAVLGADRGALIGQIGLFEIYFLPSPIWTIWLGLFGIVCIGGAALASRRAMWCAALLAVLIVVVPLAVGVLEYNRYGFPWQGKDGTPFSVGLPLLAAIMIPRRLLAVRAARRIWDFALGCFAACAVLTFVVVLHRYTNGANGPWTLNHFGWQPLGGVYLLTISFTLAVVRGTLLVDRWTRPRDVAAPVERGLSAQAPGSASGVVDVAVAG